MFGNTIFLCFLLTGGLFQGMNVFGFKFGSGIFATGKPGVMMMSLDVQDAVSKFFVKGIYGNEWTLADLLTNIQKKNVEFASLLNNLDMVVAVDKHHEDHVLYESNLHYIKTLPQITQKIVDLLVDNNVEFKVMSSIANNQFWNAVGQALNVFAGYFMLVALISGFRAVIQIAQQNRKGGKSSSTSMNPMNLFGFGSGGKRYTPGSMNTTFADVAGCTEAKSELIEVVDFLKDPQRFSDAGANVPKGVLLEGPPGTGKTLLARATAGEAEVNFISASASEFVEMFVGVGASRIREIFDQARRLSPCIVFIDEIDAIGKQRGSGFSGGNDERDQTLNQLLTSMDGFEKNTDIIVMASTNRADILDKALLRSGRFDRKVKVGLPDRDGRRDILDVHLRNKKLALGLDLSAIYDLTPGFSGADLQNLVNEAAIMSVRYNMTRIDDKCFMDAYEKITIGLPKSVDNRDEKTREMVAFHESGHALVAKAYDEFVDVRKVTINANNNGAGGYTLFTPKERYVSFPTKKYMFASMVIAMAGRAAEIILYNEDSVNVSLHNSVVQTSDVTLGSSADVRQATVLGREYIRVFGAEDGLGAGMVWEEQSESTKAKIEEKIADLIRSAEAAAVLILKKKENVLRSLSKKLLKSGTVSGNEMDD